MKRFLLALVPWMVLAGSARGQARPADVLFTYHDASPSHAYRVGDECFVPVDEAKEWGWTAEVQDRQAQIHAEGKDLTEPLRMVGGRPSFPLRKVVDELGGISEWVPTTDTLSVVSPVKQLTVDRGRVQLETALSVRPSAVYLSSPGRVVLDFAGAKLTSSTSQVAGAGVEITQYKPNVVRVVVGLGFVPDLGAASNDETRSYDLRLSAAKDLPAPPPAPTPTKIGPLRVANDPTDDSITHITIPFSGVLRAPPQLSKPSPATIELVLPSFDGDLPPNLKLPTTELANVTSRRQGGDTVLSFKLARPMGAEVSWVADAITLTLAAPAVGDGRLAGKIIVVDPGHGGFDSGAHEAGISEKDLNLSVGLQLARKLQKAGATVILTRDSDVFISLSERCAISNRNNADFFISCHHNASGGSRSMSGSTTYHHFGRPECRLFGESIQAEIAKVCGLPNIGVKSDGSLYRSGLAVLRGTKAVGVLLELGFVDNTHDRRRLITPEFQDAVTTAVVDGVKDFLGERKSK